MAQGGSGGLLSISVPTATLNANPVVTAYDAAALLQAGGNVSVSASATGSDSSTSTNGGAGVIQIGTAHAFVNQNAKPSAYIGAQNTYAFDPTAGGVVSGNEIFLSAPLDVPTGTPVVYESDPSGTAIGNLTSGTIYYVIADAGNANGVELATSRS